MADAAGVRAGRAYVEIGTNNAPLTSGLRRAAQQVKAFGQAMQAGGMAAVRGGAILGIPLGFGAKMFGEFESWMARVKALAGPTADQFAALNKEALRLGAETVFTSSDAAKAMSIFAQAGLKANDILKATGPTLDLAATGMLDMAQATDISLKVMKGMGLQTSQLGSVVDVLAKAMTSANTDLVMLGEAFKYVGPVAKSAGMSIHETAAAIMLLSDAGIQADMAGTTLRGMILSLAAPSEEAKKEMQRLGVAVNDAKGDFRGLVPIVADMERALKGVGTGARLLSLGTIFSARQAAGAAELLDQGADKLARYTDALKSAGGTSAFVAATQLDTLAGAWKMLTSSLEGVLISLGKGVAPLFRKWGESLTGAANAINLLIEKNPELFQTLAKVSAGLVAGGVAIVAFGAAVSAVGALAGAFVGLAAAVKALALIYMNPTFVAARQVTWLLVIPGAMGKARAAWADFAGTVRMAANSVMEVVGRMRQDVSAALELIGKSLSMGDLASAARVGALAVRLVWAEAVDSMSDAWADLLTKIGAGLAIAFHEEVRKLRSTWIDLTAFFGNAWDQMVAALRVGWNEFAGFMQKRWEANKFWLSDEERERRAQEIDAQTRAANQSAWDAAGASIASRNNAAAAQQQAMREAQQEFERQALLNVDAAAQMRARQTGTAAPLRQQLAQERARLDLRQGLGDLAAVGNVLFGRFLGGKADDLAGRAAAGAGAGLSARMEAAGTFSSFGVGQSLAFGKSLAERAAGAAEETAKNTKELVKQGGGRFG